MKAAHGVVWVSAVDAAPSTAIYGAQPDGGENGPVENPISEAIRHLFWFGLRKGSGRLSSDGVNPRSGSCAQPLARKWKKLPPPTRDATLFAAMASTRIPGYSGPNQEEITIETTK